MNNSVPNGMTAPHVGRPQDQFHHQSMTTLLNHPNWPQINQYPHQPQNHHWQQPQQNMQNGQHMTQQHPQSINVPTPATANSIQHALPNPALDHLVSVFPQQVMQDFYRLSAPVGQSPNDDSILTQALFQSKQSGKTYRQALEGLHGVNNHAANLWKDYYLDHHDRFDVLVARLAEKNQQPSKAVKKPFTSIPAATQSTSPQRDRERDSRKRQPSPSPPLRQSRPPKRSTPTAISTTPSLGYRPPKRPRATLNSLSAPLLPANLPPKLMSLQADIILPPPPSRSPTPPTRIEAGTNGNKYTEEDRAYFLKFISWRLSQDASLTKKELCAMLHEKAPHHSAPSWTSHWHNRHDIADKILHSFQGEEDEDGDEDEDEDEENSDSPNTPSEVDEDSESEVIRQTTSSRRHTRPTARVPNTKTVASRRVTSFARRSPSRSSDIHDPSATTDTDEADMGAMGGLFTPADWRIIAKYVARTPGWNDMVSRERWEGFLERFPNSERSDKSWAEFYRRNEDAILSLAAHYKGTKWLSNSSIKMQQGRPSWARNRGRRGTEGTDEKGSDEDGDYEIDDGER
ncbi:uncharacterized protein EDB91DRAFT_1109985 [Suillus paluster]|uniref:uncharacterized protein n=1 Tax=Suillus paluster TaxID=48578 RepID=UPI001B86E135|nr:uncharacterized protein EDB91DRAFT_1109985 [Suillus paluster]KAG1749851.1 hypothetical protein EDB91DRAFT_1109985 [Suillus paluster]